MERDGQRARVGAERNGGTQGQREMRTKGLRMMGTEDQKEKEGQRVMGGPRNEGQRGGDRCLWSEGVYVQGGHTGAGSSTWSPRGSWTQQTL